MNFQDPTQLFEDLKKLKDDNSEIVLTLNPSSVWILVFQIQIALKHPFNTGKLASETREIVKDIQSSLDEHPLYTECLKQALDWGWDADFDDSVKEYLNRIQQGNNN
ncbi:MAG: hypothetical protein QNJ36_16830 [Calothrix sp. MO_167.B42]|nr:hypothetical protein [Calothrix sp. MO_167.B42]